MKLPTVQAFVLNALTAVSIWATTSNAQVPRLAIKLTSAALAKQKSDPNFVSNLVQKTLPAGFVAPRVVVGSLVDTKRSADLIGRIGKNSFAPNFQAPNFDAWYQVSVRSDTPRGVEEPRGVDATGKGKNPTTPLSKDVLDMIHTLHKFDEVETVHVMQAGPPPAVNAADDPRSTSEGYLDAAPAGINARYAWGFTGGDGANVNIVDVEQGWNLNHEDLVRTDLDD